MSVATLLDSHIITKVITIHPEGNIHKFISNTSSNCRDIFPILLKILLHLMHKWSHHNHICAFLQPTKTRMQCKYEENTLVSTIFKLVGWVCKHGVSSGTQFLRHIGALYCLQHELGAPHRSQHTPPSVRTLPGWHLFSAAVRLANFSGTHQGTDPVLWGTGFSQCISWLQLGNNVVSK